MTEVIPALSRHRTSSQQERHIRQLAERKSRFKYLEQNILKKEAKVIEASANSLSFEVLQIHKNKEDEIEAQNEFTRNLIEKENTVEKSKSISYPSNSFRTPIDRSLFNKAAE